jgi:hypothetical protein
VPEPALAARVQPAPERPLPATRRAIFFDVENTSRAEHISRVIAHLAVDRGGRRTEFFAVGNWRVIGHDTARLLARHGAQLVHSAPSVGVRDWSDLRIAVASGVWLASARADDVIEIVSDDRAFDAVGDVAAGLGVTFRRLSYRGLLGVPVADVPEREAPVESGHARQGGGRSRRGRRGRRHGRPEHAGRPSPPPSIAAVPSVHAGTAEPHTAPHDEIVAVVRELAQSSSGRNVTLDTLANALKARGFSRPPGSPRLITRLRRIKQLEVSRSGVITLHDGTAQRPAETETVSEPIEAAPLTEEPEQSAPPSAESEPEEAEVVEPGNDRRVQFEPRRDDGGQGRRRSRRGGRRRRGGRGGGGGGGGRPPMDQRTPPRDAPPRDAAAREAAVREAFRTRTAPSYITGEPLA